MAEPLLKAPGKNELMIGITPDYQNVVINHPNIDQNEQGGHIILSTAEAYHLAALITKKADEIQYARKLKS